MSAESKWFEGFMNSGEKNVPIRWRPARPHLKPDDISAAARFALSQPDVRVTPHRDEALETLK